ncbi:uncharacterized protein [Amphiura filiformis]|uniref:uncharacterized protein n=1 Tax=Amphiura filiformis TaxID=82378 RepID=UPI003B21194F
MEYIHSLLVESLGDSATPPFKAYIGLALQTDTWNHRWVDGRPLSYTDWIVPNKLQPREDRQPDGGHLESCVLIHLANFHSTDHWHDVPCVADNDANQYICMKHIQDSATVLETTFWNQTVRDTCPKNTVACKNGECIHRIHACLPSSGCQEQCNLPVEGTIASIHGHCRLGEFQCKRSAECVSVSFLCDYVIHCIDGSDEEGCYYPECKPDEYVCSNGQCIDGAKRCDLITDCITGSDEQRCDASNVGIQCYDGTWIPTHAYCDGQRDCAGKNWEDESLQCDMNELNFTCSAEEIECKNGACVENVHTCMYGRDPYGFPEGCRDATHLENCEEALCGDDTLKCPNSYCIPLAYQCDETWDCPNGEDEIHCDHFNRPGYYKCHDRDNFLSQHQMCDGTMDCPGGDDELFCGLSCPDRCICVGLFFSCVDTLWNAKMTLQIHEKAREMHLVKLKGVTVAGLDELSLERVLSMDLNSFHHLVVL